MFSFKVFRAALLSAVVAVTPTAAFAESLREALTSAYTSNPQMTAALLSVKASAENIVAAKAGTRPNVSATGSLATSWSQTGNIGTNSQTSSIGLSYSQTLFDNFSTEADVEQARALSAVASETLRNTEQNVLLSAASAYASVVRDTKLVQLRAENLKFYQAQVQSTRDRLDIGEGTRLEVSQSEAGLASATASYQSAIASLQESQASYERWVGHRPQNLSLDFGFDNIMPQNLDQARAMAEQNHPAIKSAQAQLRAAQSASDAARAAFGPTLSLVGRVGQSFAGSDFTGAYTNTRSGSITLNLSIPIYSGGALGANVRRANINQIISEVDALSARDQVRESVISSWAGMQNTTAQIAAATAAVNANEVALDGVMEEQRVGQSTTLNVLDAQADLTSAEEGRITAESSKIIAMFSLLAATGQLSATELGLTVAQDNGQGYVREAEDVWQDLRSISE